MDVISNRQRIARWLQSVMEEVEGDSTPTLVLRHVTINDRQNDVATFAPRVLTDGEHAFGDLVQQVCDAMDTDADGLGGVQRYLLFAYGDDRAIARLPLRAAAPGADVTEDPLESEPATPKGLLAQLMRHNEVQTRMFALSYGQVIATMQRTIARLQSSSDLADDRRLEAVAIAEEMLSEKHERELATLQADREHEYNLQSTAQIEAGVSAIVKLAAQHYLGGGVGQQLTDLIRSFTPKQWEALHQMLSPDQLSVVNDVLRAANQAATPEPDEGAAQSDVAAGAAEQGAASSEPAAPASDAGHGSDLGGRGPAGRHGPGSKPMKGGTP